MQPLDTDDGSTRSTPFDIVAVCASAGGFSALRTLLAGLTPDFPAAVVIVQHLDPRHRSLMAELLAKSAAIPVAQADERSVVSHPLALVAPPDRHMLVNPDGSISLTQTELVHFVRPSADLLFESVAGSYGERAIAVVLTGTGTDGAQGVQAIKATGGTVIVQEEATAEFPGMPSAAIRTGSADLVLPLDEIAPALVKLTAQSD